jgi:Zn-dependent protease
MTMSADSNEPSETRSDDPQQLPDDKSVMGWLSEPEQGSDRGPRDPLADDHDVYLASLADQQVPQRKHKPRRRILPLSLFLLTCISTFFAGACMWVPMYYLTPIARFDMMPLRRVLISHWQDGLIYMACVLAILLTHEMGHFIATLRHRIPASYPYFLPLPISPIGTLGAVIGMDGMRANRKQMFDIGIAGPLAGLVVAIPILLIGVARLDFSEPPYGWYKLDTPLSVRMLLDAIQPEGYVSGQLIWHGQLNPFFMAGWVGLLITGLNMMPVSQLDGGHVTYTLFGKKAHWIARGFMLFAVAWVFYAHAPQFLLMILLIMLVGTDHPPTSDDGVRLGWFRTALGWASLSIPILCFAPRVIVVD